MEVLVRKVEMNLVRCPRCNHEWMARVKDGLPKQCPQCKGYLWKRDKKKGDAK